MDAIVNKLEQERKRSLSFYDTEAKKIAEIHRIAERQALDQAKGFRQSHGEVVKLKKEMTEVKDLFDSLYRKPAKFKDFKPFKVTEDIMQAMTRDLGREMIDAGEAIRKNVTEHAKEQKKHISLYKEWRKGLTGVLIDLHWLRILGANSKILAMNTQMLGKAFGYLIDMALLPLVPAMVQFTKYVIGVAKWIRQLPQPARLLVAGLAALAIGVTTLGTILMYATSALTAFSAAVTAATAAETGKTAATGAVTTIGGAAIGGGIVSKFKPGVFFAPEMFPAMKGLGGEGEYSHDPRERLKILGKMLGLTGFAEGGIVTSPTLGIFGEAGAEAIIPLSKIGKVMEGILGAGAGVANTLTQAVTGGGGIATSPTPGIFDEGGAEAIIPLSKIGKVMGGILGAGASFANTLTQAATGGGGVGGGLNMGGGTGGSGGLLAKGFTWVAMAINQGFKVANELLAALLTLVAQGGGGLGGTPKSIWDFIIVTVKSVWEFIKTTIKSIWEFITGVAKSIWEWIVESAKSVWEWIETVAKSIWEWITVTVKSVWEFIKTTIKSIWEFITGVAKSIWEWIVESAKSVWEWIETVAKSIWEWITVTVKSIWEFLSTPTKVVWEFLLTPVKSIWDFITTDGKPTGKPTPEGGGTPTGSKAPIFEGLQKVFENGVYIGDWELYSDGTKKWRPNPNISELAGTTAPPTGAGTVSPGQASAGGASAYGAYITEGADNYAKTINTALQESSNIVTTIVPESTTSFTDVFVSAVTGVGNMIWNGLTDAAETVYDVVTGAASAVGDAAISAITTANNWLSSTFGGIGGAVGIPAPPFIPPVVAAMATGGSITSNGLAFLHKGETVIPAAGVDRGNAGGGVTINNPTFVISGRTERELFENFMRMMKSESARVH